MSENIFFEPEIPATIMHMALFREYGTEWYSWEPEVLCEEVKRDFHLDECLNPVVQDKLQAIATLVLTDQFFSQWEMFENIAKAFNHQRVFFESQTPLTSEECTWAIIESYLNDDRPQPFSAEVKEYIKTVYKYNGLAKQPSIIENVFSDHNECVDCDQNQQKIYHARVRAYVVLELQKIADMGMQYFKVDMKEEVKKHFPKLKI